MEEESFEDLPLDPKRQFDILLNCMINSMSHSQAAVLFIISQKSEYGTDEFNSLLNMFETIAESQRKKIIEDLYQHYGWLPPDILGQSDQKSEP
jgi:hypothetical protein